jgi:hypothetical protein
LAMLVGLMPKSHRESTQKPTNEPEITYFVNCPYSSPADRQWWLMHGDDMHDVVTVIRSLVPITSMKASSLSFSIAPRPAFIEVETTVGPARARGRPRMRAVPYSDLCVSSRRSRGYEKPKRAFTGPLGSTQHRELRPAHRKRPSHRETKRASNGM